MNVLRCPVEMRLGRLRKRAGISLDQVAQASLDGTASSTKLAACLRDIRAAIEETPARVGDEVDALSYKTDVGGRVGDYVDEKKRAVKDKVTGAKEAITGTASDAVPSGRQIGKLNDTAERNPLGLAVGGAAIGFLTGLLLPSTRVQDRQMGEMSDKVVHAAKDAASEALESSKEVARDAADSASEQGRELVSSLQEQALQPPGSAR